MLYVVIDTRFEVPRDSILNLRPHQYQSRSHRVEMVSEGHRILVPVEFKRGEIIDIIKLTWKHEMKKKIAPYRPADKESGATEPDTSPVKEIPIPTRLEDLKNVIGKGKK